MTDEIPQIRTKHPYIMYEMLKGSPEAMHRAIEQFKYFSDSAMKLPVYLTGIGTSYHGVSIAAYPFHSTQIIPIQSYELEHYGKPEGTIIALSHTGKTKTTVNAISKHRDRNHTIAISHYKETPLLNAADNKLVVDQPVDLSLCNTRSFFAGSMAVYCILSTRFKTEVSPDQIHASFMSNFDSIEEQAKAVVDQLNKPEKIFVLGAGPNLTTARETAQKFKEAVHLQSEGIELEEFNHGCTSVIDERTLVLIISSKTVEKRADQIRAACKLVGAPTVSINGTDKINIFTDPLSEDVSPYNNVAAGYFVAYYLALKAGINPDLLRMENQRYRAFDDVIFPPGEH